MKHWEKKLLHHLEAARDIMFKDDRWTQVDNKNYQIIISGLVQATRALIEESGDYKYNNFCPLCSMWFDEGCVDETHKELVYGTADSEYPAGSIDLGKGGK